jgi:GxxExxY protein
MDTDREQRAEAKNARTGAAGDAYLTSLSEQVIGAAFEVSNVLGAGFLEKVYENALLHELRTRGMRAESQKPMAVHYKSVLMGQYFADLLVEEQLLVELKCCDKFAPEHLAQCLNYLKASGLRLALLVNFQKPKVEVKRIIRDP